MPDQCGPGLKWGLCSGRTHRIAVFIDLDVGGCVAGIADGTGRVTAAEAAGRVVSHSRRTPAFRRDRARAARVRRRAAGPAIV